MNIDDEIQTLRDRLAKHQFEEIRCREALEIAQQLVLNDCIALDEKLGEKRRAEYQPKGYWIGPEPPTLQGEGPLLPPGHPALTRSDCDLAKAKENAEAVGPQIARWG